MCGGHFFHTVIPLLTTSPQTVSQPPNPRVSSEPIRCPNCASAVSANFIWCPKCGSTLKAHPCAYCGQILDPDDKLCGSCGASSRSQ